MKNGKYLKVKVDMNDGDYNEKLTYIDDETLKEFQPLFEAINSFKPYKNTYGRAEYDSKKGKVVTVLEEEVHHHNFPKGHDFPRLDLGEKFPHEIYEDIDPDTIQKFDEDFTPYGEYGFHTIESIEVIEINNYKKII